ncbi:MAG: copper chaperone PCu(A)C [Chloroflexi bacterium]|nr:copper chaperone PCu(A)C [Chloroflexota bacterium]
MNRIIAALVMALLVMGVGCSGKAADNMGMTSQAESDELLVMNVWGRNSPMAAPNGAFYMTIVNNTDKDEQLLSASANVCAVVELHEMYMMDNNAMGMRQVTGGVIVIPAGETVELKVGGLHVMCIDKTRALELGETIPVTLNFANAGEMTVNAEIREEAMDSSMNMGG